MEEYRIRGRRAVEIAADVERAVEVGTVAPGALLPPQRMLATDLGVNPNTVAVTSGSLDAIEPILLAHLRPGDTVAVEAPAVPVYQAAASYRTRRDALLSALAERDIPAYGRTGFNVWIPVSDETAVIAGLLQRGWAARPGAPTRLESPPGIRPTVSSLSVDEIPALADAIADTLNPYDGFARTG